MLRRLTLFIFSLILFSHCVTESNTSSLVTTTSTTSSEDELGNAYNVLFMPTSSVLLVQQLSMDNGNTTYYIFENTFGDWTLNDSLLYSMPYSVWGVMGFIQGSNTYFLATKQANTIFTGAYSSYLLRSDNSLASWHNISFTISNTSYYITSLCRDIATGVLESQYGDQTLFILQYNSSTATLISSSFSAVYGHINNMIYISDSSTYIGVGVQPKTDGFQGLVIKLQAPTSLSTIPIIGVSGNWELTDVAYISPTVFIARNQVTFSTHLEYTSSLLTSIDLDNWEVRSLSDNTRLNKLEVVGTSLIALFGTRLDGFYIKKLHPNSQVITTFSTSFTPEGIKAYSDSELLVFGTEDRKAIVYKIDLSSGSSSAYFSYP